MTSTYLSDDCIYDILKYLQNYRSTLFNCLLVNRFWCKETVPLIYANPFDDTTNEKPSSVILTLILCFNKIEILQLKNQLKFLNIKNKTRNLDIDDKYKPLFEYPKYLENFDYDKINSTIFRWIGYLNLSHNQRNKIYDHFIPKFHQSILRRILDIKQLNISPSLFYEVYKNCNIQTFTSNLTKLNSLTLNFDEKNTEIIPEFLSDISNICLNLRKLEILFRISGTNNTNDIIKEKLCTVIKKQNNLKGFQISFCNNYVLKDILLSLGCQKHSLVYIEFNSIDFSGVSFKNFINLSNLKYLRFGDCKGVPLNQCDVLEMASFKLKVLIFKRNKWNKLVTSFMIKSLGASLKELILGDEPDSILEDISTYCPTLITLEIKINLNRSNNSFDPLLLSHLKMRELNINLNLRNTYNIMYKDKVFMKLAKAVPINIKEISICFLYSLSSGCSSHFEEFLENCHDDLEIINICHPIEFEFLKIVLRYTKRSKGNLKFLGMTKLEKALNNEELQLLAQIRSKGVNIIDFYSIYKKDDSLSFII